MEFVCECGKWFELPYSKKRQVLKEVELFCSPKCASDFIISRQSDRIVNPLDCGSISECTLEEPLEYWDKWTGRFYRSKSEAIAANFLTAHNIPWEFECYVISIDGTNKTYNPDFFLPFSNTFIEVKGLWQGAAKKKVKCTNNMGLKVVVFPDYLIRLMERELREADLF